jgi:quinol monooxygenase YgiN
MVELVWTFDVPVEKHSEYIEATAQRIKPVWEARGCLSYDVWQATEGNPEFMKRMHLPDVAAMEPEFMKRMLWPDMAAMEAGMQLVNTDAEVKSAVELFMSFVPTSMFRIYIKKT